MSTINFGQLFIVGFEGTELSPELATKLKALDPAGIIFYDTNIASKEQVIKLIKDLKSILGEDLIITVDQEGGKVQRLRKVATNLPSLQALGRAAITNPEFLVDHSRVLASELYELGFNLVLAPCADLATNPLNPIISTRSLGADPDLVSEQLQVIIQTYQESGIKTCVKHFPGHGDTSIDSHLALPVQNYSPEDYTKHLEPFIAAISAGVDTVMIAHLISQAGQDPASISAELIHGELRVGLGFTGLVLSDEITMKALNAYGNYSELSRRLIDAGNNLVIWNSNLDDAIEAASYLNKLDSETNERLYQNYFTSIALLANYRENKLSAKLKAPVNKEELMLNIAKAAMEFSVNFQKTKEHWSLDQAAVLVFKHPKLEADSIKSTFQLDTFVFDGTETSFEFISSYKNLLVLSFQTVNNSMQKSFIEKLRAENKWNIIQASCDSPDHCAEINLYGAAKVHYLALKNMIEKSD